MLVPFMSAAISTPGDSAKAATFSDTMRWASVVAPGPPEAIFISRIAMTL